MWPHIVGVKRPADTDDEESGAWQQVKEEKSEPKGWKGNISMSGNMAAFFHLKQLSFALSAPLNKFIL